MSSAPPQHSSASRCILGLTGSIGMGKSMASSLLRELNIPVFDADEEVKKLYLEHTSFVESLKTRWPHLVQEGGFNRTQLAEIVFQQPAERAWLESQIHPLVRLALEKFLQATLDAPLIVLDIPLLFENGLSAICHKILVMTAPFEVQRERVLARPGMNEARFMQIVNTQMSDTEKRYYADYVIDSSLGEAHTRHALQTLVEDLSHA